MKQLGNDIIWFLYMYLLLGFESKERQRETVLSWLRKKTGKDLFRGKRNLISNPNMENEGIDCSVRREDIYML